MPHAGMASAADRADLIAYFQKMAESGGRARIKASDIALSVACRDGRGLIPTPDSSWPG
jgi:hypothetical protein